MTHRYDHQDYHADDWGEQADDYKQIHFHFVADPDDYKQIHFHFVADPHCLPS